MKHYHQEYQDQIYTHLVLIQNICVHLYLILFQENYYNYQYSTGISIASYVANKVLAGDEEFIAKYKKFLSVGSRMYPMEALKIIDIDMSNDTVANNALETFNNLLTEFDNLYKTKDK